MLASVPAPSGVSVPPEATRWVTWLRFGVIAGLFTLLMASRLFAHLPFPVMPIVCIAGGAAMYNTLLALVVWRLQEHPTPLGDRMRARVVSIGHVCDTLAIAFAVAFTGALASPLLYFFVATSIVSSAILPLTPSWALTGLNALVALIVVVLPPPAGAPLPAAVWSQPGYAAVAVTSLIGLMAFAAYAVSTPAQRARRAVRFQESLAQIGWALQRAAGLEQALDAVCKHAHEWFGADRTIVSLLAGEELVVKAGAGVGAADLLGRTLPVSDAHALEVEVLRRRSGFYVNDLPRSAYATYPAIVASGDRAVLLVPLLGSLGELGVLSLVDCRRSGRFSDTTLQQAAIFAAQAGVAVENAQLLDRVREEAEGVSALLGASARLTKSADLPTLLTDLNRIACETTRCDRSTTFLWDVQRQLFHFGSTFGNSSGPMADAMRYVEFKRGGNPLIDRLLAGEAVTLDAAQALAQLPITLQENIRLGASALVPLSTEHGMQGVMTVSYFDPQKNFSANQLWLLRGIAGHAALAIERARLIAQEREATATAEAVVALGRELSATLDRQRVLSRIPEMAATAAGCDFALLSLWDRDTARIQILGTSGFSPESVQQLLNLPLNPAPSGFTDATLRDGYFEVESPQSLPGLAPDLMQHFQASSLLCFIFGPVEQRLGALTVGYRQRTGPFSAAQKRLVNGIAQQATVVLENTRLVDHLRQANRVKSDFLSTVSHELRTPLNAIIGYTDLLREQALGPLQPEQLDVMNVVAKKGVELLELINMTLDVTRLEAGQTRLDLSEFVLDDLLAEIRQDLAEEKPALVEFSCTTAPGLPRLITDRAKLKTVIKNLTHNALKFTRRGQVEVRAEPAATDSEVRIVVRDTGIGIAARDVGAIFEMFRQLEPVNTRQFGGVGLGLYIVQRLLELVHGEVRVESEPEKGSVFTVTVPVRLVPSAP